MLTTKASARAGSGHITALHSEIATFSGARLRASHLRVGFAALILGGLFFAGLVAGAAEARASSSVFVPTSAWLVGPASLAVPAGGGKLPCVMVNQFDNGFTLRVSGGGQKIFALAVDVRQPAFTPGRSYPVALRIGKNYAAKFDGVAYNAATLIVNTQEDRKIYDAIGGNHTLAVDIAGQTFDFAILGMPDGLARMEACYNPGANPGARAGSPDRRMPPPAPSLPAPSYMEDDHGDTFDAPLPGGFPDMKSVQNALPQDIEPAAGGGTIRDGGKAMVTNWSPVAAKAAAGAGQRDIIEPSTVTPAAGADVEKRWRALKGANLRDVLEIWSKNAGTDLVWMPEGDFAVKESVVRQGALEAAVLELLQQYDGDSGRPVGKLYSDPAMNRKVLLIREEQGG